jgi:hypothetical protein
MADKIYVLKPSKHNARYDSCRYSYWNETENSWVYEFSEASKFTMEAALASVNDKGLLRAMGLDSSDIEIAEHETEKAAFDVLCVIKSTEGTYWHTILGEVPELSHATIFASYNEAKEHSNVIREEFYDEQLAIIKYHEEICGNV